MAPGTMFSCLQTGGCVVPVMLVGENTCTVLAGPHGAPDVMTHFPENRLGAWNGAHLVCTLSVSLSVSLCLSLSFSVSLSLSLTHTHKHAHIDRHKLTDSYTDTPVHTHTNTRFVPSSQRIHCNFRVLPTVFAQRSSWEGPTVIGSECVQSTPACHSATAASAHGKAFNRDDVTLMANLLGVFWK